MVKTPAKTPAMKMTITPLFHFCCRFCGKTWELQGEKLCDPVPFELIDAQDAVLEVNGDFATDCCADCKPEGKPFNSYFTDLDQEP
jgi:hypothetical protein